MKGGKMPLAMIFKRWKTAFHSRHTGAGYKPLIGAVVKNYGIERMKKRQLELSGGYHEAGRK
jgi:hypothetical protein